MPITVDKPTVKFVVEDNIVIAYVKPCVDISKKEVVYLKEVVDEYIEGDFGFIDNRSCNPEISIKPEAYEYGFSQFPNLKAFALVFLFPLSSTNSPLKYPGLSSLFSQSVNISSALTAGAL